MSEEAPNRALFRVLAAVALALGIVLPYLVVEGIRSVARGHRAGTSLGYELYSRLAGRITPDLDPLDPNTRTLSRRSEIEALIETVAASQVALGNSPFEALQSADVSVNRVEEGCLVQKPNLRKVMSSLRSNLFNPFDPMTYFHDADRRLPPELEAFFSRYGFRRVRHTTNEFGERITLPAVEVPGRILVAGDSVAVGVLLDDAETIASQLQARDPQHRYVNLGVAGADARDVVCALERAAKRYAGTIRGLVYVFCENDFSESDPYGDPDALVEWLSEYRARENVPRVTLVFIPYVYNAAPDVTRVRGHGKRHHPTYAEEKRRLFSRARQAGFGIVDFVEIAEAESQAAGSRFAVLALYLDHVHPSRLGVRRLVARVPNSE